MNYLDFARHLLEGGSLESKLFRSESQLDHSNTFNSKLSIPKFPGREEKIKSSEKQVKFPKKSSLHIKERRAVALHFFANHELLAIEMMAAALLKFPLDGENGQKIINGLLGTIRDEQKHLSLYIKQMNKLGVEFGEFPLNDFFWRQISQLNTVDEYFATMSLTFEQANLDFAICYGDIFTEVGDLESAEIMKIVLKDEIKHVAFGQECLSLSAGDRDFWDFYLSLLPEKISPSRGKGMSFAKEPRVKAGLSENFIQKMQDFRGDFSITERKEWKS
ncbi:MAG: DUF455 family protein [Halobacteriovoraceae bacterium]|jgi:uncharacterized ferritin-like protein (DUF455 family)|nr:DUF455 family protein [Halobacteriovoraceae bacterium]MBT5093011.1 DUF455 family protein [Halobacteriovoraceae bacterium]